LHQRLEESRIGEVDDNGDVIVIDDSDVEDEIITISDSDSDAEFADEGKFAYLLTMLFLHFQ
jgi:hypothetical protein